MSKPIETYTLSDWLAEEDLFLRTVLDGIRKRVPAWRDGRVPAFESTWSFLSGYMRGVMLRQVGFDGNPMTGEELTGLVEILTDAKHEEHCRDVGTKLGRSLWTDADS